MIGSLYEPQGLSKLPIDTSLTTSRVEKKKNISVLAPFSPQPEVSERSV